MMQAPAAAAALCHNAEDTNVMCFQYDIPSLLVLHRQPPPPTPEDITWANEKLLGPLLTSVASLPLIIAQDVVMNIGKWLLYVSAAANPIVEKTLTDNDAESRLPVVAFVLQNSLLDCNLTISTKVARASLFMAVALTKAERWPAFRPRVLWVLRLLRQAVISTNPELPGALLRTLYADRKLLTQSEYAEMATLINAPFWPGVAVAFNEPAQRKSRFDNRDPATPVKSEKRVSSPDDKLAELPHPQNPDKEAVPVGIMATILIQISRRTRNMKAAFVPYRALDPMLIPTGVPPMDAEQLAAAQRKFGQFQEEYEAQVRRETLEERAAGRVNRGYFVEEDDTPVIDETELRERRRIKRREREFIDVTGLRSSITFDRYDAMGKAPFPHVEGPASAMNLEMGVAIDGSALSGSVGERSGIGARSAASTLSSAAEELYLEYRNHKARKYHKAVAQAHALRSGGAEDVRLCYICQKLLETVGAFSGGQIIGVAASGEDRNLNFSSLFTSTKFFSPKMVALQNLSGREARCAAALEGFRSVYPAEKAEFIAVAPGRVNLIGEHVDHQGYPVLPVALNRSIQCVVGRTSDSRIRLHFKTGGSVDCELKAFRVEPTPCSADYVAAALLGLLEYITEKSVAKVGQIVGFRQHMPAALVTCLEKLLGENTGFAMYIEGDVPIAAGVSSSSALVVAVSMAFCVLFNLKIDRTTLADICTNAERHSGTAGGGMDQAAILLCDKGVARHIHFQPLRTEPVRLPESAAFVLCNSMRGAPKAVHAGTCYNKRVFELKLACFLLYREKVPQKVITKEDLPFLQLQGVQESLNCSYRDLEHIAKEVIPEGPVSKAKAIELMGEEYVTYLLERRCGQSVWELNVYFEPLRRVIHCLSETQRVQDFVDTCALTDLDDETKLQRLGALMNSSDESLALYFDCSCPELMEVTTLARDAGAYGSRLTGAGWGGCTVSLVHKDKTAEFVETLRKKYFGRKDRLIEIPAPTSMDDACFAVIPDSGASIYELKGDKVALMSF